MAKLNRNERVVLGVVTVVLLGLVAVFTQVASRAQVSGDGLNALMGRTDRVQRFGLGVEAVPASDGAYTNYLNVAAYEWHPGTYRPYRKDGPPHAPGIGPDGYLWPILAYYKDNRKPLVVWYWGGSFRSSNGGNWGVPERWAYVRMEEEVWDPIAKQGRVPGLEPSVVPPVVTPPRGTFQIPKSMQYQVDALKLRYTTQEIMDAIDASPFDEPSEGAPEEVGAAPR